MPIGFKMKCDTYHCRLWCSNLWQVNPYLWVFESKPWLLWIHFWKFYILTLQYFYCILFLTIYT